MPLYNPVGVGATSAELNIEGGQSVIKVHGSMGSTETFDPTDGNVHTGTLDANLTITLNAPSGTGAATLELWLTQDGTGGRTITWPGSVTGSVTPDTTAGVTVRYLLETIDGGTNWLLNLVGGGGSTSPLTTKGDLWGYSTVNARIPMGTNTYLLNADSTATLGVAYIAPATVIAAAGPAFFRELVMQDGVTAPPEPIETEDGTDWLYADQVSN